MECPSCGAPLREGAVFCSSCGERVTAQTVQTRIPPAQDEAGWDTQGPPSGARFGAGSGPAGGPRTTTIGGGRLGARPAGVSRGTDQIVDRLRRLARLDTSVFREARDDPAALVPSLVIAAISILLMALGGWLWLQVNYGGNPLLDTGRFFARSVIIGTILGVALWVVWIAVAAVVLAQAFHRPVQVLPQIGALGMAAIPMALGLLMFIDPLREAFGVLSLGGAVMLTQVGLQETAEAPAGEVFVANLAGFAVFALALGLLGHGSAELAPGIFAMPAFSIPSFLK
jgi:hypothetical protein